MAKKIYVDETGREIPSGYISNLDKEKDRKAAQLLKKAIKLNSDIAAFKELAFNLSDDLFLRTMREMQIDIEDRKGNYTWFSFDRAIKIEVAVNERVTFTDESLKAAEKILTEYLNENITSKNSFVINLVTDAFRTTNGRLDASKITELYRYEEQINDERYTKAMKLLRAGKRVPGSKQYFRIYQKDSSGEYRQVDLNFSSIGVN